MKWRGLLLLLPSAILCGCGGSRTSGPAVSPGLDMFRATADGRLVRYEATPEGTLRFAGGLNARDRDWSWEGRLDAEAGAKLQSIIDRAEWIVEPPKSTDADGDSWEVSVRSHGASRSFSVHGDPKSVRDAWAVLEQQGRQRLDRDLELLPKPDIDRLVERRRAEQQSGAE
ncbi:MAG: hypothetical protein QF561_06790 [Phycisphaerales bacterium]|nr:hypothetical protein [Phycisphaerales bacterium]